MKAHYFFELRKLTLLRYGTPSTGGNTMIQEQSIGIMDSGSGGLFVLQHIRKHIPSYDYIYLGDHLHAPYGTQSFEDILFHTKACVEYLGSQGCPLIVIACNTASAKALRNIQQLWLPHQHTVKRVLGIIIPTAEEIGQYTRTQSIGILATPATVSSLTFEIEIHKLFPNVRVHQQACPTWVDLVENHESYTEPTIEAEIKKYVDLLFQQAKDIDTVILGCTHYPLLRSYIRRYIAGHIAIIDQGEIVALKLEKYLHAHPEIESLLHKGGTCVYETTGNPSVVGRSVEKFLHSEIDIRHVRLDR